MVDAKNLLRVVAEKWKHFFDDAKYVTVDGYIAATYRYVTVTLVATLPITFSAQEEIQGVQKIVFGSWCGLKKKASCRASYCDSKFSSFPYFDLLERTLFMLVTTIIVNSETREQAMEALERLIQKLPCEEPSHVSSQETPHPFITDHAMVAYS